MRNDWDFKKAVELFAKIERLFDVNSIKYKTLKIWPMLRLNICNELLTEREDKKRALKQLYEAPPVVEKFSQRILKGLQMVRLPFLYYNDWLRYRRQIRELRRKGPVEVLCFSRYIENIDQFNGSFYNILLDPLLELLKDRHSFLKIELESEDSRKTQPRLEPTHLIDPDPYARNFRRNQKLKKVFSSASQGTILQLASLQAVLSELACHIRLDEGHLLSEIRQIEFYKDFFTGIISAIRPKVVFLACFEHNMAMGLIWACKNLKVTTVNIQHGLQGKYSPEHSHWTRVPQEGYQLLEDLSWNWGKESQENINKWHPPGCRHHYAVVGGNLWLAKWVEGTGMSLDPETQEFLGSLCQREKVILVSLQWRYAWSDILPSYLLQAMRLSPPNWLWLIRLHPNNRNDQKPIVEQILKRNGISNFEIEHATRSPLYALLKNANHHLTCWSTVGYESLAFGVPTTIIHPEGLNYFKDYIDQGLFNYAVDSSGILAAIRRTHSKEQLKEPVPYIEASKQRAEEALQEIFQRAGIPYRR